MSTACISQFRKRLYSKWLPGFCHAPHRNLSASGFKEQSLDNLSEHDALWFLRAIELDLVTEADGFFTAPLSRAKEQIFWTGSRNVDPRPLTLWIEPVITIGALAKLNLSHKWPAEKLGTQSQTWAFDLVGYGDTENHEFLACEVKKTTREIDLLIELMKQYGADGSIQEPEKAKEKNAYRKSEGIRRTWPSVFWALGPNNYSKVFDVIKRNEREFELVEMGSDRLTRST